MCGIAGIISKDTNQITIDRLKKMTGIINYRGPDGEGHWMNSANTVGLGHRRLSIIDLSEEAGQPMHYAGRYTIVFNGEIYNYIELKEKLLSKGYCFATSSDTEVLMAMYDLEKENCLSFLDGMFSFVIYDDKEKEIFAAKDRFGEKPFYYSYQQGKYFLFGSEMKCLWAAGMAKEVNNKMLFAYLAYGNLQNLQNESETFYNNCSTLPHSHYLKISVTDISLSIKKYYHLDYKNINYSITEQEAKEKFRELFFTSVKRRLRSDVAVGSSLSGGLDSSLIVRVIDKLKKEPAQKQNTFSAIFPGFAKNEKHYIDYVIDGLNVSSHFTTPDHNGMICNLNNLLYHQEEPFGSTSIYVQYCVMELAKKNNVTVLLDGQGADEYLAGYHSYFTQFFYDLKSNYPDKYEDQYEQYMKLQKDNKVNTKLKKDLKYYVRMKLPYIIKPAKSFIQYYRQRSHPFFSKEFYNAYHKKAIAREYYFKDLNGALYESLMHGGLQTLLRYADRNSMAHSREIRLPFLFHELVEFVFSLPPYFKIKNGWTKWIMRASFEDVLPKQIALRKDKIGFEPPQKNWLQNASVKEKIQENKRKLLDHKIISRKEYENENYTENDHNGLNKSWDLLMAGELF